MSDSLVLAAQQGPVLTLTLNRPAALNSFTEAMHQALRQALDAAAANAEVRCVVLTGAGRGFCAGQDLADPMVAPSAPGEPPKDLGRTIELLYKPLVQRLKSMPVPVSTTQRTSGFAAAASSASRSAWCMASVKLLRAVGRFSVKVSTGPCCRASTSDSDKLCLQSWFLAWGGES